MCLYFGAFEKHKMSALEDNVSPFMKHRTLRRTHIHRETNMFQIEIGY